MKQAILLLFVVIGALELAGMLFGGAAVLIVVFGAMALMAVMIAATFLWLWLERTTPLALGMVLSWAGIGLVTGWWWLMGLPAQALDGEAHPVLLGSLAFMLVGAVLHFSVIHRSFGRRGAGFLWPVGLAFGLSVLVQAVA